MARKAGFPLDGSVGELRSGSGAISADSSTLTDANFPTASGIVCTGLDTIFVGVEITGGSGPTMTIEALFRDAEAPDGSRWKRLLLGQPDGVTLAAAAARDTGALDGSALAELRVFGADLIFLRVSAVANAGGTTAWKVLGKAGRKRPTQ